MYLGLDCGTSGLKALLTDESGKPLASATRAYAPDRPRSGWSEQNPDVWADAMAGAIAEINGVAGGGDRRAEGDWLLGPDAWRGASRPRRQAGPARHSP